MVWVEYRCITWRFKNRPHIYVFLTKNFYGFETVFALWFSDFPTLIFYMRIMQSENFATYIHAHYRQSETAPIYAHYMREKFRPRHIWELRCVWNWWAIDWASVSLRSFVSFFVYAVIVLDKVVFVDWLMLKFGCKSVMGLHKFIVKMWLCRCNCMCICVCIWRWL